MYIGDKLRRLRASAKRTLVQEGKIFGVSPNTIYRWEHGISNPKQTMIKKIAKFYNVPIMWLVSDDDEDNADAVIGLVHPNSVHEQLVIKFYKKLPLKSKHKILKYLERIYIESLPTSDFENDYL